MWNTWPFRRKFTWTRRHNVYAKEMREISWGSGAGRIGYINYRDGARRTHVFFELGSWSHDIKLRQPDAPWTLEDGTTETITLDEARAIMTDIAEALSERDYKVGL